MDSYNVCFIISLKYFRGYTSYIDYYVSNIQTYYENSLILIVDNNSTYIEDVYIRLKKYENKNLVILTNNSPCKFELGAYKVGIQYIIDNNIVNNYEYFIFTQDSFILKNKYDFNTLKLNDVYATPIMSPMGSTNLYNDECYRTEIVSQVLEMTNLTNNVDLLRLCWANSFALHNTKIILFLQLTQHIIITSKYGACMCERFLSPILYRLNNDKNYSLDKVYEPHEIADVWNANIPLIISNKFFLKCLTAKDENTQDL